MLLGATFPCSDPKGLVEWYVNTLGSTDLPIAFVEGEAHPHHFALHVGDLGEWRTRLSVPLLRDEGGFDEFDFSAWGGARAIYFGDPEGSIVELIARPVARPELSLAEVGLPVTDVAAAVAALETELDLPHYDGDRQTFSAVGDDGGLLIVVSIGRGWFPIGTPAGAAPVAVTIAGAGTRTLEVPGSKHVVTTI